MLVNITWHRLLRCSMFFKQRFTHDVSVNGYRQTGRPCLLYAHCGCLSNYWQHGVRTSARGGCSLTECQVIAYSLFTVGNKWFRQYTYHYSRHIRLCLYHAPAASLRRSSFNKIKIKKILRPIFGRKIILFLFYWNLTFVASLCSAYTGNSWN